ncbi:hypothetical protein SDC9_87453 [bioreactor metagenome]|uniref:Uncharacterized protein n=1 Tax=bioreactor metagenome TaxID=1076179 RepID=A0A644ZIU5_9ZZZZ
MGEEDRGEIGIGVDSAVPASLGQADGLTDDLIVKQTPENDQCMDGCVHIGQYPFW